VLIHEHAWADLFPTNAANVSILPQVHNSKRFSTSELTSYNFVLYRKSVLRIWKIYMLYIYINYLLSWLTTIIKRFETILIYPEQLTYTPRSYYAKGRGVVPWIIRAHTSIVRILLIRWGEVTKKCECEGIRIDRGMQLQEFFIQKIKY
jgi:hypothetical protein